MVRSASFSTERVVYVQTLTVFAASWNLPVGVVAHVGGGLERSRETGEREDVSTDCRFLQVLLRAAGDAEVGVGAFAQEVRVGRVCVASTTAPHVPRRNVDGVCPSRVARLTLLMCTLSMSACGRGMLHPSHLCQTGVGGSGGSVHETAGLEDDSRRSSCEVCWTRRCVAGSLWKVTLHFHRKLMQSFFFGGS